ncbi:MAG: NAD(P)H-dependent oxidoreductase subunit E [Candidatus Nanopelagicaceae bacterium]|jgi:formate dehydrogenase subunit gamma
MTYSKWDVAIAEDVIATFRDEPGPVLIALQALQAKFGFVHDDAHQLIADAFNVSRAEVFGVFTYYHDLKSAPQSENTVKICAAEACQALGCDELIAAATKAGIEVEKAYCFGNCALGPAAMIGDRLIGRATLEKLK